MPYEAQLAAYEAALAEWEEICAAMAAAREALAEEVERVPSQLEAAAQRALDALTSERLRRVAGVIQSRYDTAAEAAFQAALVTDEQVLS